MNSWSCKKKLLLEKKRLLQFEILDGLPFNMIRFTTVKQRWFDDIGDVAFMVPSQHCVLSSKFIIKIFQIVVTWELKATVLMLQPQILVVQHFKFHIRIIHIKLDHETHTEQFSITSHSHDNWVRVWHSKHLQAKKNTSPQINKHAHNDFIYIAHCFIEYFALFIVTHWDNIALLSYVGHCRVRIKIVVFIGHCINLFSLYADTIVIQS